MKENPTEITAETEEKRFRKNDSGFICAHCGKEVRPLGYSSRNHCPFCLWSLHLDENPGDRRSECGGGMEPVSVTPDPRKGYIINHRCTRCGATRRCKAALAPCDQPDNMRLMISLTVARG